MDVQKVGLVYVVLGTVADAYTVATTDAPMYEASVIPLEYTY
jgi:hypothetical protein